MTESNLSCEATNKINKTITTDSIIDSSTASLIPNEDKGNNSVNHSHDSNKPEHINEKGFGKRRRIPNSKYDDGIGDGIGDFEDYNFPTDSTDGLLSPSQGGQMRTPNNMKANKQASHKKGFQGQDDDEEVNVPKIDVRMLIVAAELPFATLLEKKEGKYEKALTTALEQSEDIKKKNNNSKSSTLSSNNNEEKKDKQKVDEIKLETEKKIDPTIQEEINSLFSNIPLCGVYGRNWLPKHRTELATLLETLIYWRASDFGREILLLSGSGGGSDIGMMSTLSLFGGGSSMNNIEESSLASFSIGPTGDNPSYHSAPLMNPMMKLKDKEMILNKQNVFQDGKVVFKIGKIIKERNYGLFSFGVFHDPDAPGGTTIKNTEESSPTNNNGNNTIGRPEGGGRRNGNGNAAISADQDENKEEDDEPAGSYIGHWLGEIVPLSEMHFRHPIPGQSSFGTRLERDSGFDGVRAPPWWTQKFPKNSDAIFVDDDVRLLAVENDLYIHLTRKILKSKYFESSCRDVFNAYNIADVFSRDRRLRQCLIEDSSSLLKMISLSIQAIWNSHVFGDKGRNATCLIGEDDFVMNMILLHCLEGNRTCFENAENFMILLRSIFKGAGLVKFASLIHDDDEQLIIGRWAIEQTAKLAQQKEKEAQALAAQKEAERLEQLKITNPDAYQEALADAKVINKAKKIIEDKEKEEKLAEELEKRKIAQKKKRRYCSKRCCSGSQTEKSNDHAIK
mmetsp:Transcript_11951/g.15414  ORF Transcript_11951/g.15414 Transcript_11951/m.15414 type:complete len:735 (-) Transcript_11951:95-2299(-)